MTARRRAPGCAFLATDSSSYRWPISPGWPSLAAAQRAGVPYRIQPATLGTGSDAGPFSRAGLKATTLLPFKWPQQQVAFYHQVWDTPEVLTIEPLLNVLKLTFEWVRVGGEESDRPQ